MAGKYSKEPFVLLLGGRQSIENTAKKSRQLSENTQEQDKNIRNWRDLYIAALFEPDKLKLPLRIAEAERALIQRDRELFVSHGKNSEEGKAVDRGLYGVRALRNCLKFATFKTRL